MRVSVEPSITVARNVMPPRDRRIKDRHSTAVRHEVVRLVAVERQDARRVAAATGISYKLLRRWVREAAKPAKRDVAGH